MGVHTVNLHHPTAAGPLCERYGLGGALWERFGSSRFAGAGL